MSAWVLVLTLWGSSGVAIATVPFTTEAGCMAAAEAWRSTISWTSTGKALCVATGMKL